MSSRKIKNGGRFAVVPTSEPTGGRFAVVPTSEPTGGPVMVPKIVGQRCDVAGHRQLYLVQVSEPAAGPKFKVEIPLCVLDLDDANVGMTLPFVWSALELAPYLNLLMKTVLDNTSALSLNSKEVLMNRLASQLDKRLRQLLHDLVRRVQELDPPSAASTPAQEVDHDPPA